MAVDAVRAEYARRAAEYTDLLGSVQAMAEEDRFLIERWADSVDGPAMDAGCGPGHWTAFLHERGVDAEGIDLVPEFVAAAAARFPDVPFRTGRLEALPVADGSLAGILAWYSIIHTEPTRVPVILDEFARCLRPGGTLLLGFFEGPLVEPFAHAVVTAWTWPVTRLHSELHRAGFEVVETHTRTDEGKRPHGAVLARRR